MHKCHLSVATCTGNSSNCIYPNSVMVSDRDSFIKAISFYHVCGKFKVNYRSKDNFISSDCIPMDCDNDHSDDEKDWVTPFDVAMAFPDVCFYASYSRNHMKDKGGKSARPRFHVYFPTEEITDANEYAKYKEKIHAEFPYFDDNALDAARFIYGVSPAEVEFYEGSNTILDFLLDDSFASLGESIESGNRNNTMSHIAGKLIKRFGDSQEAYEKFLEQADRCDPPLPEEELSTIWNSARKFGNKVSNQAGYIPPEKYNLELNLKPDDLSDVGQAVVLAREYGDKLRYSPATDFLVYNGRFWEESQPNAQSAAQELTSRQLEEAEVEIQNAVVRAINKTLGGREQFLIQLQHNIEDVLNGDSTATLEYIDQRMADLQEKLVMCVNRNAEYDVLANEIDALREKKVRVINKDAEQEMLRKRINEMRHFPQTQTSRITEYDEQLVRRLISKITVYDDKLIFEFKSGMTLELKR